MPKNKIRKKRSGSDLFLSEKVLADAPLSVQELLQSAKSKPDYHLISSMARQKQSYHILSDAKKKSKGRQLFKVIWPSKKGPAIRTEGGYTGIVK